MSLSASAENLTSELQNYDGSSSMCLELALEGERLCKACDCRAGVVFFQAAIQAGTDDLRTLSAIYSQLGNAYFYLGDYPKAMQYHKHDLTLARTMGDKLGEAKSSGNLGNTLKVMGRFDEAVLCCKKHLELSRELDDRLSEGRALYNLGNVYHAKGKHVGRVGHQDHVGVTILYIIQTWVPTTDDTPNRLLEKGYRLIMSTKNAWYLDHGFWGTTQYYQWRTVYKNRLPRHEGVLGGEACIWGEYVDQSSIDARVWPRVAAVAERLWSDPDFDTGAIETRFYRHRDRLVTRGISADALAPGWCFLNEGECR